MKRRKRSMVPKLIVGAVFVGGLGMTLAQTIAPVDRGNADIGALAPPSPVDARLQGIGSYVPDATGTSLAGTTVPWRSGRGEKLTVIAMTSVSCPMVQKFGPALARIESAYADKGVKFVHVNVSGIDSADEMKAQVQQLKLRGLYLNDSSLAIAGALKARTTTEVFVVDAANTLVYRGAISDRYGVGFAHDEPRQTYLTDALDALLAGHAPAIPATNAPGCAIELPAAVTSDQSITYARHVSRIIAANCIECHRGGGVAPFSLETFESVSRRARMIEAVTQEGIMPPWFAAPHTDADGKPLESPWANDRSLSQSEKEVISAWIAAGKPKGDEKDLPLPRVFAKSGWTIGEPDAVFQIPEPIAIKAEGTMPYQNVMVPTRLAEDKWVRAMQIAPTDKSVVHHVLVFVMPEAALNYPQVRRQSQIDESRGYYAAYVPGNDSIVFPEGLAKRLPKNSVLMFQIHYTPNGKPTTDKMKIGMVFTNQTPKHIVRTAAVADRRISIPPGANNHEETASVRLPADAKILAFMPHMHVRGKAYRYELQRLGKSEPAIVLDIPRYNFNWQLRYTLREPLDAPAGSTLIGTAWYDNSAENPANPDPTKTVRWGPQTYDEMMLGYVEYYLVNEDPAHPEELPAGSTPRRGPGNGAGAGAGGRGPSLERLLTQFDANKDGKIEKSEVPENLHRQFERLDRNGDGVLTREDFAR